MKPLQILVVALGVILFGSAGRAETPEQICARLGADDAVRPLPSSLVDAVNRLFDTRMPDAVAVKTTVYRCAGRQVLVCTTGANLPCGKADTQRTSVGATEWCREHPDAAFVPKVATGQPTIYEWRCDGRTATIAAQTSTVDPRGFIAIYWRPLP